MEVEVKTDEGSEDLSNSIENSVESNLNDSPLPNLDESEGIEKNGIPTVKPTFKSILQAKKRLQAFSSNKQIMANFSPKKSSEDGDKVVPKKSKKEISPDDKLKNTIKEIESLKLMHHRPENDQGIVEQMNKTNQVPKTTTVFSLGKQRSNSSERESQFRKLEVKSRNYRRLDTKSPTPEIPSTDQKELKKEKEASSWADFSFSKSSNSKESPKTKSNSSDFYKFYTFSTPSPTISSQKLKSERGEKSIPFKYIRQTKVRPHLFYSINFRAFSESHITKKQLFNIIPSSRRELIDKLVKESSKIQPSNHKMELRKWFPKSWRKTDDVEGKLLENSVGLSFLQSYSDEEETEVLDSAQTTNENKSKTDNLDNVDYLKEDVPKENSKSADLSPSKTPEKKTKEDLKLDLDVKTEDDKPGADKVGADKLGADKPKDEKPEDDKPVKKSKKSKRKEDDNKETTNKKKKSKTRKESTDEKEPSKKKKKKKKKHKVKQVKDKKQKNKKKKLKSNKNKKGEDTDQETDRPKSRESIERRKIIEELKEEIEKVEKAQSKKEKKIKEEGEVDKIVKLHLRKEEQEIDKEVKKETKKEKRVKDEVIVKVEKKPSKKDKKVVGEEELGQKDKIRIAKCLNDQELNNKKRAKRSKSRDLCEKKDPVDDIKKRSRSKSNEKLAGDEVNEVKTTKRLSKDALEASAQTEGIVSEEKTAKRTFKEKAEVIPLNKVMLEITKPSSKEEENKNDSYVKGSGFEESCLTKESRTPTQQSAKPLINDFEGGTPDKFQWESDDDIPPPPKELLNRSWESDEEVFDRHIADKTNISKPLKPISEVSLEIPLNITPYKQRHRKSRWDKTLLGDDISNLTNLSEERLRLEREKIKIQQLELQFENLERKSKRTFEKYDKSYKKYKKSKKTKKDNYPVLEVDLSKVKVEKNCDDCESGKISSSTDFDIPTPNVLENEYEEFMKAVAPCDNKPIKSEKKRKKQKKESSSSSDEKESNKWEDLKIVKIKEEKSPEVPNLQNSGSTDLLNNIHEKADAPTPLPLPVPVPSPQLDGLPKPILNMSLPPLIDIKLTETSSPNTVVQPSVDDTSTLSVENLLNLTHTRKHPEQLALLPDQYTSSPLLKPNHIEPSPEQDETIKRPFIFTLPVKKPLITSTKLHFNDESDEEQPLPEDYTQMELDKSEYLQEIKERPKDRNNDQETRRGRSRSPLRRHEENRRSRSPRRRHSPIRRGRESPDRRRGSYGRRSPIRSPPRGRRLSPSPMSRRRRSPSPRRLKRRSLSPKRKLSPRRRSISPKMRPSSPKRRKSSPLRNHMSIKDNSRRCSVEKFPSEIENAKRSPVRSSPMEGLKKSLADSTISDDLLPQPNIADDYTESPISRFYDRTMRTVESPKRMPLDIRINQVLGIQKLEKIERPPVNTNMNAFGPYIQYNQYPLPYAYGPPPSHVSPQIQIPAKPIPTNKVVQVGNMLQIVPTEDIPIPENIPTPVKPTKQKILQVGNMLQIVPETLSPQRSTEQMEEPSTSTTIEIIPEKPSIDDVMKQKVAERRAEREKRRLERERRRKEKEKRHKEKEKQKQLKLKLRTENMIKRALQQEEMEEEEGTDDMPQQWPPLPVLLNSTKEVGKSILVTGGKRKLDKRKSVQFADGIKPGEGTSPSGGEELGSPPPSKTKLPKEKRFKKTKVPKKIKKKKIKVKVVKKPQEESDEEDNLPPPSPPPGSPPPHLFPPRVKTHTINNIPPSFSPAIMNTPPMQTNLPPPQPLQHTVQNTPPPTYQTIYRPPPMSVPPPVNRPPPPLPQSHPLPIHSPVHSHQPLSIHPNPHQHSQIPSHQHPQLPHHLHAQPPPSFQQPPPPPMSQMNMFNVPRPPPGGSPWT